MAARRSRSTTTAPAGAKKSATAKTRTKTAAKGGTDVGSITASSMFDYLTIGGTSSVASQLSEAEEYWHIANRHPWIGACVRMIAGDIAADSYEIVAPGTDKDQSEVDKDPRVDAIKFLLDHPNNSQSLMDLVEEISLDYDITGRAFLHILRVTAKGVIVGLERIDSRTMAPSLSDDGTKIVKFVQKVNVNGHVQATNYEPNDIIFFKLPGGKDVLGGESLLEQLDFTLGVDFAARKHNAAYFRNGCKAGLILTNQKASPEQMRANKQTLELTKVGPDNAYKMTVLGGEWEVSRPDTKGDEEFGKGQDRARQEVCAVFRVPESKLVTEEGTLGQAGKNVDDQTYHEDCVAPRAKRIWRILSDRILVKELGITDLELRPKAKYQFRLSAIGEAVSLLQSGGSINEARSIVGLPKSAFDGADLDAPYVASTVVQVQDRPDPLELAKASAHPVFGNAPGGGGGGDTPPGKDPNNPAAPPATKGDAVPKAVAPGRRPGLFRVSRGSVAM